MHQLLQELAVAAAAMPPHLSEQPLRIDRVAGVREQHLEQPRLGLREAHRLSGADAYGVLLEVEADAPGGGRRGALHSRTAQQRLDAREEGARTEGLGEIVVGAEAEGAHQVLPSPRTVSIIT